MYDADFKTCESEPINIPGAVQAYGALLVLDVAGFVRQVSANCAAYLGCDPETLLGQKISTVLQGAEKSTTAEGHASPLWAAPVAGEPVAEVGRCRSRYRPDFILEVVQHCNSQGRWIVECEVASSQADRLGTDERLFQSQLAHAMLVLYDAKDLGTLIERAVSQVFACFGYDRVMAYQFDRHWHGTVIAEALRPGLDPYLGQRFPASDIPSQARATFLRNALRTIPDVDFVPQGLLPSAWPPDGPPLEMGSCHLRAPSPIHIEYLHNMGVSSTMTLSLIHKDKLWGLIACHHLAPLTLCHEKRRGAEMLSRCVSSLLANTTVGDDSEQRRNIDDVQKQLFVAMSREDDLVSGLRNGNPNLLHLMGDTKCSAAIFFEGCWSFIGPVPTVNQLSGLVRWLSREKADTEVYATESLISDYPPASEFSHIACGLLAINVPKNDDSFIFWLRPEVPRVISWAGNPVKNIQSGGLGQVLHPRKSFEQWREVVKNRALPWESREIDAAHALRKNIIELDLKRQFDRERLAHASMEAEKQRFSFLADAAGLLGASLDYRATLRDFAGLVTSRFCDWVCIYLEEDGVYTREVIAHSTPQGAEVAEELRTFAPICAYFPKQTLAVFNEQARLFVPRADTWLRGESESDANSYIEYLQKKLGFESMLLLPIVAREKTLGVIKFVRSGRAHRFTADDQRLAAQLCQRAASCVDNALMYRHSLQAIQARDHVMGVVSHDLRNPLGAVRLTADLMARRLKKSPSDVNVANMQRSLGKIHLACRRMDGLIEDVLSLSKIEAGRFQVTCQPTSIQTVFSEAVMLLEPLAVAKGVELVAADGVDLPDVLCDIERVMQVFSNLLGNAIKFTPPGGRISVDGRLDGGQLIFSVGDTG
ncbi:MAG: GAF domain-containing protein, partial [Cytophagaceae bacterium]